MNYTFQENNLITTNDGAKFRFRDSYNITINSCRVHHIDNIGKKLFVYLSNRDRTLEKFIDEIIKTVGQSRLVVDTIHQENDNFILTVYYDHLMNICNNSDFNLTVELSSFKIDTEKNRFELLLELREINSQPCNQPTRSPSRPSPRPTITLDDFLNDREQVIQVDDSCRLLEIYDFDPETMPRLVLT